MTAKRFDVVQAIPYTHKDSGELKTRYKNCGTAYQFDDGAISIRLDLLPGFHPNPKDPVSNTCVLKLFEPRDRNTSGAQPQQRQQPEAQQPAAPQQQAAPTDYPFGDDIPF